MTALATNVITRSGEGWNYLIDADRFILTLDTAYGDRMDSALEALDCESPELRAVNWAGDIVGTNDLGQEVWVFDYQPIVAVANLI